MNLKKVGLSLLVAMLCFLSVVAVPTLQVKAAVNSISNVTINSAPGDVGWIEEEQSEGVFDDVEEKVKGVSRSGYSLMMVIGGGIAVLCIIAVGILFMLTKSGMKRSENFNWLLGILGGIALISSAIAIYGLVFSVGNGM